MGFYWFYMSISIFISISISCKREQLNYFIKNALVANYVYDLVKEFNNYYQNMAILTAETEDLINYRLGLSTKVGEVIKTAMRLLGASVPDRM